MGSGSGDTDGRGSSSWRGLSGQDRFLHLLSHYETSAKLAEVTGFTTRSVNGILSAILDEKNTPSLQTEKWRQAMRSARHRMTDQIRGIEQRAQKGKYVAPVSRSKFNTVVPKQRTYLLPDGRTVTSSWVEYRVAFLPDEEIFAMARELYSVFLDTGQFNMFRFGYLCQADYYSGGVRFKNRELREASEQFEYIKLSTSYMPFLEIGGGNPIDFENWFRDTWSELQLRGGYRINDLAFRYDQWVEKKMPLARDEYDRWKKHAGKKQRKGKGRGH